MNRIYNVVWNYSILAWTVVSELGRGRKKSPSFRRQPSLTRLMPHLGIATLLLVSGKSGAQDISSNTDFSSSATITDGLFWTAAAAIQIDPGAVVTVSNPPGAFTINMAPADGSTTRLWVNGGTLSASDNGNILLGSNSFLQIGGSQLGGVTSAQAGGSAGTLSVGNMTTEAGASTATFWMFGSTTSTAKLNAASIDLRAGNNVIFITRPADNELGADINVTGDMTVVNGSTGNITINSNSQLTVGGDLYLDTTGGTLVITGNENSAGITVGGNMTLTNNVTLSSNLNDVSTSAGLYSTIVNVNGDINLNGNNVGNTGLQMINAAGSGVTAHGSVNITSAVSGNTTTLILGHAAKLTTDKEININSTSGGAVNVYIGDPQYGAPASIAASSITMSGDGANSVIFNNNKAMTPGIGGYIFDVPLNGNGRVVQQSGHTTLDAVSNYTAGTTISGGLLSVANNQALGSGDVVINTDPADFTAGLDIAYSGGADFTNVIAGTGNTTVSGDAVVARDNSAYQGNWNVTGTARTTSDASVSHTGYGSGTVNIANTGSFIAQTTGSFSFDNSLTGNGLLVSDNNNGVFNFSGNAGNAFAGTAELKNNTFDLSGTNTSSLENATLESGSGNVTTVGTGTQNIGGLAFSGGTLVFGDISPGQAVSDAEIETRNNLDLSGSGTIQITRNDSEENPPSPPAGSVPLLQQDDAGVLVKLVGSQGTVTGSGGDLRLVDQNDNAITDAVSSRITQNGETVATGIYDYRLTSGDNQDGLYINYGLTKVELLTQGDNALTLNATGNSGSAADLSATVTGSGDLRINTDTTVSLSNSENNYTGATWVDAGTLAMGNNNVLGMTRLLTLAPDTGFDMNGHAQVLQNLSTAAGSTFDIHQGALTVNNGSVSGNMKGAGNLTVTGGTLNISSDNPDLSTAVVIASDGTVNMLASQALGTGSVDNQGLLILGQSENTANQVARATFAALAVPAQYQMGSLTNSGTVVVGHNDASGNPVAGTTLTVNGNYTGQDGHLLFNSILGNENSVTDRMIVTGNTSGKTGVSVTNAGGEGDAAVNGIELITVNGTSAGEFQQEGRIVAGAYDYRLVRGNGENQNNWYLVNNGSSPPTTPPVPAPDNRPEGGSYIANLAAANTLFNTTLHDRLGETQYIDALTGEEKVTSLWLRQVGNHNSWRDESGQLSTQSNSYVAQLGGDLAQWSTNGLNRLHLGLMAGYGNSRSNTHSSATNFNSKGSVNGYSVGAYATWFANEADKSGLYVDSWLQYSWFNNDVNGEELAGESYKSKGVTGSVETGYAIKIGEFTGSKGSVSQWFIQPQAQITWLGVSADTHREANGTNVDSDGDGNIQTRLGIRTYLKGHSAIDASNDREFEPFIEANWLHNTRNYSAVMDGVSISQAGTQNIGEVKAGVEGQLSPRVNLWGNVGVQIGDAGYNNTGAMVGVKYSF